MIGVFLVHVGLVCVVRDLAKKKLSRLFISQEGFFTQLHLQNYSMSLFSREIWAGDKLFFNRWNNTAAIS